ncbi:hypothetical protein [Pedobacter alluvionis]|uniref:Uncharacterized protein n=1 Tax=Pedobacter alluvionis TaxID=475253 RepID=A0A497Y5X3_9SPHI|nr:hypothetical protein [Pedobacter alluvionis]RLJ77376.1 hypothetical protein BCL90_2462 [Pedobacter alluvionis]TFB33404.1 hypothetical protein E3V97_04990 [Pedobacter alluvionis]
MRIHIDIKIPYEFELICMIFSLNTVDVLQDYLNRISLPKHLSSHPDDPFGDDIQLILCRTKTQDPEIIEEKLMEFLKSKFEQESARILDLGFEQPETESLLRKLITNCCPEIIKLRLDLRNNLALDFKIEGHDN